MKFSFLDNTEVIIRIYKTKWIACWKISLYQVKLWLCVYVILMEGLFVVSVGSYFYGDQTLRLIFLSLAMHGKRALKSSHQRFKFKYTDDYIFCIWLYVPILVIENVYQLIELRSCSIQNIILSIVK